MEAAILDLQVNLEDGFEKIAAADEKPAVVLCDRGVWRERECVCVPTVRCTYLLLTRSAVAIPPGRRHGHWCLSASLDVAPPAG